MNNQETNRAGLEQGRAAQAYQYAVEGSKLSKNKEFKSYVKKMPMLIKANGLGAAVAFAFAKGSKNGIAQTNEPWGLIYSQLEDWLEKKGVKVQKNQLARLLTETSSASYRSITIEVLALLNWMKRFADALIEGESED